MKKGTGLAIQSKSSAWLATLCAAAFLLIVFADRALAQTDDYGNTCDRAFTVSVNTNVNGRINYAGDWDYFKISVPSDGTLTVYTTGSTDTYGYLEYSNGGALAWNDDQPGGNLNFRISQSVTAGTYCVAVRHYNSNISTGGTGSYTLVNQFSPTSDDHSNSITRATGVRLNSGINGRINYAGDYDYFCLAVTSTRGKLTVYTTGSTDTYGYLKDSRDNNLASNDDQPSTSNFRIAQDLTQAGIYYVAVRHYSSTGTGDYRLQADFAPATGSSTVVIANPCLYPY